MKMLSIKRAKSGLHIIQIILPAVATFFAVLTACRKADPYVNAEGIIWNTSYHITYKGPVSLTDSIFLVLDSVGKSLNVFDSTSLVSKANLTDEIEVDENFRRVYEASRLIHKSSNGMFDPTLSPLITAWGFGKGHTFTADTAAVDSVLKFVGLNKTSLKGKVLHKEDIRTQFNFSAIAKGFGCDKVGEMLKRNGVTDYIVEIGGEITLAGNAPGRSGWRVAIDKPVESTGNEHQQGIVVNITDCGLATSGNYRNFHKEGKTTLGHTISPITGRPVQTDVISATVMAPTCMEADGAATACMAAGSVMAKRLLNDLGYEGMLILSDTTVWMSEGFMK